MSLKGFTGYDTLAQLLDTEGTGYTTEENFIRFVDFLKVTSAKKTKKLNKKIKRKTTPPCIKIIYIYLST